MSIFRYIYSYVYLHIVKKDISVLEAKAFRHPFDIENNLHCVTSYNKDEQD